MELITRDITAAVQLLERETGPSKGEVEEMEPPHWKCPKCGYIFSDLAYRLLQNYDIPCARCNEGSLRDFNLVPERETVPVEDKT